MKIGKCPLQTERTSPANHYPLWSSCTSKDIFASQRSPREDRVYRTLTEGVYWDSCDDPYDVRQKLELFKERYDQARPHWELVAAEPPTVPARVLTPHEVYVQRHTVDPPSWSRWVGWLEKDREPEALPPSKTLEKISA